jgi:RNA polymerase sigma-70 factor (ECF subfamily)
MDPNPVNSFNEIYIAFYKKSYLFVKSYVHDDMAAEDIVSEALIKVWELMKQESVESVPRFLFTILKNRSLDYLKHQAIIRGAHDSITKALNRELEIRTATLEANDPNDVFSTEVQHILESTLNSLPERTREIFLMSHFGNKPYREIADFFNISVKGVDYHIMQSVKALKSSLKDYLPFLGTLTFLH